MSRDMYVNVTRVGATTPALTNIYMQLDNIPVSEVLYYEGIGPAERFNAYTTWIYDIRQTDILTDINNIDSKTGNNYQYRVITIPEPFPDMHMELECDLLRGGM